MANVNRPTDPAQKEKDINQKLQLYGIYSAFANGKVPSNKQIDVALNSALASKPLSKSSTKLSSEGQGLVKDVKLVIEETKKLLLSKNEGNLIQEFVWDSQHITGAGATGPGLPVDKETAKQEGEQAVDGLKTLGRLILSNGQFRKLLDDALVLARDVVGDAATTVASKVNPDESRLQKIDEPAEDNTWHDVPDLSKDNLKQQASSVYNKNKPFSAQEAKDAARDGANTAQQHPSQDNQQAASSGINTTIDNLKAKADENISEEDKQRARDAKEAARQKTRNYAEKKMPKERREQTIWRLKKMLVEIQGHSDYQRAIVTLLDLAERYASRGKDLTQQTAGTVKGAHSDDALTRVEANLKTLVERFANFTSLDDLFDSLNQIYRDADQDPELKGWFRKVDTYIRKCLREQGFVLQDQATEEWNQIYDQGQFLFKERYRDHTDHVFDEAKFLADQFEQDPQNKAFASSLEQLFLDLGRDENGKPAFKPHLIKDLTEVIIPAVFENTRYVPIPRIEVSDPMVDLVVENLVIESDNLFPNALEFGSDNYWRYGRKSIKSKRENKVMIAGSGIQMDLKDVAYYLKKKQGFPSITDKGVMDIVLAGDGFSFKLAARNAHKATDRTHFLVIDKVDVTISNLQIKVKKSNHKLLFTIAKGILLKVMKPAIQKAIEKQIKDNFEKADAYAYDIYREVQKGVEAAKEDPENATNIYQRYVNAVQQKMNEKKQEAEKAADRAKKADVNVALTQKDSIFKNISLPGGISTKATEYKDLAAKGDKWESPVFGIGSAKESTSLPSAQKVIRKPHQTRSGGIRGSNHPSISGASGTTLGDSGYATQSYPQGSTGTGLPQGTQSIPSHPTAAATGLGQEMNQAFSGSTQPSTTGGSTTYYDSATR